MSYPLVVAWCMVCEAQIYWDNDTQRWARVFDQVVPCAKHIISATPTGRFPKIEMPPHTSKHRAYIQGPARKASAEIIRTLAVKRRWNDSQIAMYVTATLGRPVSSSVIANIRNEFSIPAAAKPGRPIGGKP